jgi:hypothetical protein
VDDKSVIQSEKLPAKTRIDILKAKKSPAGRTKFAPALAIRLAFLEIDSYPPPFKMHPQIVRTWFSGVCAVFNPFMTQFLRYAKFRVRRKISPPVKRSPRS